jgi:hypothetical protein
MVAVVISGTIEGVRGGQRAAPPLTVVLLRFA